MSEMKEITAYQCAQCGRIHFPYHDRCLDCRSRQFKELHPAGKAKLLAYTQIFNLPWGFDTRFLIIGIVQFENQVKAMGQIRADSLEGIKTGMTLTPLWAPVRTVAGEDVFGLVLKT